MRRVDRIDLNITGVYSHKMVVVAYDLDNARIDFLGNIDYGQQTNCIKHEGVYSFGGVYKKN